MADSEIMFLATPPFPSLLDGQLEPAKLVVWRVEVASLVGVGVAVGGHQGATSSHQICQHLCWWRNLRFVSSLPTSSSPDAKWFAKWFSGRRARLHLTPSPERKYVGPPALVHLTALGPEHIQIYCTIYTCIYYVFIYIYIISSELIPV